MSGPRVALAILVLAASSDRLANSSTSAYATRLDVSSPSVRTMMAWRRRSSMLRASVFFRSLRAM